MELMELLPQTSNTICKPYSCDPCNPCKPCKPLQISPSQIGKPGNFLPPNANFVPVNASVVYESPECVYLNLDPDIWKIQCRQCEKKSDHRCALKRLKQKFFCGERKTKPREVKLPEIKIRERPKKPPEEPKKPKEEKVLAPRKPKIPEEEEEQEEEEEVEEENEDELELFKARYDDDYDNWCHCKTAPKNKPAKRKVCRCAKYKPVNFLFQLEVTGEYKPEYVPKKKKSS